MGQGRLVNDLHRPTEGRPVGLFLSHRVWGNFSRGSVGRHHQSDEEFASAGRQGVNQIAIPIAGGLRGDVRPRIEVGRGWDHKGAAESGTHRPGHRVAGTKTGIGGATAHTHKVGDAVL